MTSKICSNGKSLFNPFGLTESLAQEVRGTNQAGLVPLTVELICKDSKVFCIEGESLMLLTPIGPIKLFVNNVEIEFKAIKVPLDKRCINVDGRYLIQYKYRKEFKNQKIQCCLPSIDVKGDIESGERLEAIAFYKDLTKLTIGIKASFGLKLEEGFDYTGNYLSNGIEYETNINTEDQTFHFGVSWIRPYTEHNEHQTWYGADQTAMPSL